MKFKLNPLTIPRHRVRRILLARRGEVSRLARELGVSPSAVANVLKGRIVSAAILATCTERAAQLIGVTSAAEDAA